LFFAQTLAQSKLGHIDQLVIRQAREANRFSRALLTKGEAVGLVPNALLKSLPMNVLRAHLQILMEAHEAVKTA